MEALRHSGEKHPQFGEHVPNVSCAAARWSCRLDHYARLRGHVHGIGVFEGDEFPRALAPLGRSVLHRYRMALLVIHGFSP